MAGLGIYLWQGWHGLYGMFTALSNTPYNQWMLMPVVVYGLIASPIALWRQAESPPSRSPRAPRSRGAKAWPRSVHGRQHLALE